MPHKHLVYAALRFPHRQHKLHIIRPASSGRSYSFRCASSPQKVVKLFGGTDKGSTVYGTRSQENEIQPGFPQSLQRAEPHSFLKEHFFYTLTAASSCRCIFYKKKIAYDVA